MTEKNEIVKQEAKPLAVSQATEFGMILQHAIDKNISGDELAKFLDTYERMHDRKAATEFHEAKRKFLDECPKIVKRTENAAYKVTRKGQKVPSKYASLEDIEETIRGRLSNNGLSYHWDDITEIDKDTVRVSCTLTHIGGHSIKTALPMPAKGKARASETDLQLYGQANTYARRYSLVQLLGLPCVEDDYDGNPVTPTPEQSDKISTDEANDLNDMMIESGGNKKTFLNYFHVENWAGLTVDQLPEARRELERKLREGRDLPPAENEDKQDWPGL